MKKIVAIALMLIGGVAFAAQFKSNPDDQPVKIQVKPGASTTVGRFQLFQGMHELVSAKAAVTIPIIFKIDSATGEVWRFHDHTDRDGKSFTGWLPID